MDKNDLNIRVWIGCNNYLLAIFEWFVLVKPKAVKTIFLGHNNIMGMVETHKIFSFDLLSII